VLARTHIMVCALIETYVRHIALKFFDGKLELFKKALA